MYEQVRSQSDSHLFMREVLRRLDVRPVFKTEDLENIPKKGPAVVVGNHPFGGIEGIIMADTLLSRRPDVKIMANVLLNRIPQLRDLTIPVDPFSRSGSARVNIGPMRDAMRWLKNGGMLLVFPAGEVSHLRLPVSRSPIRFGAPPSAASSAMPGCRSCRCSSGGITARGSRRPGSSTPGCARHCWRGNSSECAAGAFRSTSAA